MASIQTPRGKLKYKPVNLYLGIKPINRDVAFDNLKLLLDILRNNKVLISPALGTLLGIIRENNFIEWDEDIDLFVLEEDKPKLLDAFWDLKDVGFDLVRVDRCGLLYSVMRKGEYIDFYIMEKLSPEVRGSADIFMLERHLTDLMEWDFRGITIMVPKDYEEFLELRYGDWRKPVKYAVFNMNKLKIFKVKMVNNAKKLIPYRLKRKLLKKYHQKDFDKFMSRCKAKGITFQYPIQYL